MKIIGIARVRNEADIIESFVRRNLQELSCMVVVDHLSSDGTREILRELCRERLPVCVIDHPDVRFGQSRTITALLRRVASTFRPDWILPLDADEILRVRAAGTALSTVLQGASGLQPVEIPWRTHVPLGTDDRAESDPVARIRHRRSRERLQYYKIAVPARLLALPDLVVEQGSHGVTRESSGERLPGERLAGLEIAHFPVRSGEQILSKVLVGWLSYLTEPDRVDGLGYHWEELYERFLTDPSVDEGDLTALALTYAGGDGLEEVVCDGLGSGGNQAPRYGHLGRRSALIKVTRAAERLAREVAALQFSSAEAGSGGQRRSAWTPIEPAQGYHDLPPLRFLCERYGASSLLHIGRDPAPRLEVLGEWGVREVVSVEEVGGIRRWESDHMDRGQGRGVPLLPGRTFDLVVCLDFSRLAQRVGRDRAEAALRDHAGELIYFSPCLEFSSACCQGGEEEILWLERWRGLGWVPVIFETLALRAISNLHGLVGHSLLLARRGSRLSESAASVFRLEDIRRTVTDSGPAAPQVEGVYRHTLLGEDIRASFALAES